MKKKGAAEIKTHASQALPVNSRCSCATDETVGRSKKVQICRCREPVRSAADWSTFRCRVPPHHHPASNASFTCHSCQAQWRRYWWGPCCPAPLPPKYIPAASRAGAGAGSEEERTDWLPSGAEAGCSLRILPSRTDMKS